MYLMNHPDRGEADGPIELIDELVPAYEEMGWSKLGDHRPDPKDADPLAEPAQPFAETGAWLTAESQ